MSSGAYYTYDQPPADDPSMTKANRERERDPLLPTTHHIDAQGRNVVIIHDSPSREVCLYVVYGCCIFWILFVIVLLIMVILYETGTISYDDDY